ncbi:MAG: hypothetical protein U0936_15155 [Planctomycetaceae bacterium]
MKPPELRAKRVWPGGATKVVDFVASFEPVRGEVRSVEMMRVN